VTEITSDCPVDLDLPNLTSGKDGVDGFCFPLRRDELTVVRDRIFGNYLEFANSDYPVSKTLKSVLEILSIYYFREAISCYTAQTLFLRYENAGRHLEPGPENAILGSLVSETPYRNNALAISLQKGLPDRRWRTPLRRIKNALKRSPISHKPLSTIDLKHHTITVTLSSFINLRAKRGNEKVNFCTLDEWFAQPVGAGKTDPNTANVIDQLIKLTDSAFASQRPDSSYSGVLPPIEAYLRDWLAEVLDALLQRYSDLLNNPDLLPARLWTVSAGSPWIRILRTAVKQNGGTVIGHAHGIGGGFYKTDHLSLVDFQACSKFYAYSDDSAKGMAASLSPKMIFQNSAPKISVFPEMQEGVRKGITEAFQRSKGSGAKHSKPVKIMHVGGVLTGENQNFTVLLHGYLQADWYARLWGKLTGFGFEVVHKPHPDNKRYLTEEFIAGCGAQIEERPFEEVFQEADVILFDRPTSTTFATTMLSDAPAVLMDFGVIDFLPSAQELLIKRCAIVQGQFEDDGRATTDWAQLQDALQTAHLLSDRTFADKYFSVPVS
jgi:hypothetical protein